MNYCFRIIVLFAFCCLIHGQQTCNTDPSTGSGKCKSIYKCQTLLPLVNKGNKTQDEKIALHKLHCGIDDDVPAVCCPEHESEACRTPAGVAGRCIGLYSCPSMANLLKPPVSDVKFQFVQLSKCKGPDRYSVCCGPVPNFDSVAKCNLGAFPPQPKNECCGIDIDQHKILGGNSTSIDEFPWLTPIEYLRKGTLKVHGSGALISGLYVLTSANALSASLLKPVNVILGEYDTSHEGPDCDFEDCTDGAIRIRIEKTIMHPLYDPKKFINDIALIRMTRMAPYTDFIRPICLPTMDLTERTDVFYFTGAGWGVDENSLESNIKQKVYIPYVARSVCQNKYGEIPLNKGHLCAGGVAEKDTCSGDSVLMYNQGRIYEYAGIVSFGPRKCGLKDYPTVYTNVFAYDSWIRSTIVA